MDPDTNVEILSERMGMMISAIQGDKQKELLLDFCKQAQTDAERFSFTWNVPQVHSVIEIEEEYARKSNSESDKHRQEGNKYFQKKSYLSALQCYNKSVIHAVHADFPCPPKHSAEGNVETSAAIEGTTEENTAPQPALALAFGNRSAALFHLQWYESCLQDTQSAIDNQYPQQSMYKLLYRQGQCYMGLKDKARAQGCFMEAREALKSSSLDDKGRAVWAENLEKQVAVSENIQEDPTVDKTKFRPRTMRSTLPSLSHSQNEAYPNASSNVKIEYNKKKGRHMVATDDVKIGEVLVAESPFASVLLEDFRQSHCYHCFQRVTIVTPCCQCTSVIYCSKECHKEAWDTYHQWECRYFEAMRSEALAMGGQLAFRMLVKHRLPTLLEYLRNRKNTGNEDKTPGLSDGKNKDGMYLSDYNSVYNLVSHSAQRGPSSKFDFSVLAALLMKIIKASGFLQQEENFDQPENVGLLGGALIHHLEVIQCNALCITEMQRPGNFESPKPANLGVGVFPTAAMVNHECDPGADYVYYDNRMIIRAIRNINKGMEVACSYGPLYYKTHLQPRRRYLKENYSFHCECEACARNWPILELLEDTIIAFRCGKCWGRVEAVRSESTSVKCNRCGTKKDIQEVVGKLQISHDSFAKAMAEAWSENYDAALPAFTSHLSLMQQHVCPPWRDFTASQAAVKQCFQLLGNSKPS